MNYDSNKHIKHGGLAAEAGITSSALTGLVRSGAAPAPVGKGRIGRSVASFYDRTEALLWAAEMRPETTGEIVPPRDPSLYANRRPYQSGSQMSINHQRAAELYPHRLITPGGVGNNHNFGGRE